MTLPTLLLKKSEDRRIRAGHPWIYSNEVDTAKTPLKSFSAGEEVMVTAQDKSVLGIAYINPHSLITARMLTWDAKQPFDNTLVQKRLQQALNIRERLFDKPFYRLVFGESDNLPGLVIDRFNNDIVMQINTAGMEAKIDMIADAIHGVLPNTHSILLRNDSQMRELEGLESYSKAIYGTPPDDVIIEENNVRFAVPLWKGQKTGWFYDHRMTRARLQAYVNDKSVLDVFSYLGGWGVQAAAFGATHVDCVEASAFACDYIQKNAALNNTPNVKAICDDAFDALKSLIQEKRQYDVIVLDPPAFVKRFKDRKEGIIAYQRVNELALKLLSADGVLFSCSCSMHVSMEDLTQLLQRAAVRAGKQVQILERGHQGPDHPLHVAIPETDYLKAIICHCI